MRKYILSLLLVFIPSLCFGAWADRGGTGATCAPTLSGYPGCSLVSIPWSGSVTNTDTTTLTAGTWSSAITLSSANTRYVLQGNATANGAGINITANYIIVDLNGYTLTYNQTTSGSGISFGGRSYIAVINGSIIQGAASSGSTDAYGLGNNPLTDAAAGSSNEQFSNLYLEYSGNNVSGIYATPTLTAEVVLNDTSGYGTVVDRHSLPAAIGSAYMLSGAVVRNCTINNAKQVGIKLDSNNEVYQNVIDLFGMNTNGYGILSWIGSNNSIHNNTITGEGSHPIGIGVMDDSTNIDVYENKITLQKTLYASEELNCSAGIRAGSYSDPPTEVMSDVVIWNNEINITTSYEYSGHYANSGSSISFPQCGKGLFIGSGPDGTITVANNHVLMTHTSGDCFNTVLLSKGIAGFGGYSDEFYILKNTIQSECSNVCLRDEYAYISQYALFAGNNFVRLGAQADYATIRNESGWYSNSARFVDNIYTNTTEYSANFMHAGYGTTDVYWGHISGGSWLYDYRCQDAGCGAITPTTLAYAVPADYGTWGDPPTLGSDTTPPTVTSASVNGSTVTVNFSETVVTTGYDSGDFNLDCTLPTLTDVSLSSPSGSGTTRTFTSLIAIVYGQICNLDYVGSTDDIEDSAGNDMVAFTNSSVTNNTIAISTQTSRTVGTIQGGNLQ